MATPTLDIIQEKMKRGNHSKEALARAYQNHLTYEDNIIGKKMELVCIYSELDLHLLYCETYDIMYPLIVDFDPKADTSNMASFKARPVPSKDEEDMLNDYRNFYPEGM